MKFHLIGICGAGMGSVAGLLRAAGHEVRGSDQNVYPPMSTQLEQMGIKIFRDFQKENLTWLDVEGVVVVGNVCHSDHVEVIAAQERGLRLASFPQILEEIFLQQCHPLVIAGTHGKSTTAAIAAYALECSGMQPSFLIGGIPQNFGKGWQLGRERGVFVLEGDEYDTAFFDKNSKFLHYRPKTAIITGVEMDHIDIFSSLQEVERAFEKFVRLLPKDGYLVVNANSKLATDIARRADCTIETYLALPLETSAPPEKADWTAQTVSYRGNERTIFEVSYRGKSIGVFETGLAGLYNLGNLLAVIAVCKHFGVSTESVQLSVRTFAGVKRRQETRGVAQGITVVDDFAHHPTAVHETLEALKGRYGRGKLIAIFEPRSATSRRKLFQKDYVWALGAADEIIVGAPFAPEKASPEDRLDTEQLAADLRAQGLSAWYIPDVDQIAQHVVKRATAGDTVAVMTSGDFAGLHEKILNQLGDAVVPAQLTDAIGIQELLAETGRRYPDLDAHLSEILVLRGGSGQIVGCVAMEQYGESGVLRALATSPQRRGEGLGWMLADAALGRARRRGLRRVYLVTENASDFFGEKFEFRAVPREWVDTAVQGSSSFHYPIENTTTMLLDLA